MTKSIVISLSPSEIKEEVKKILTEIFNEVEFLKENQDSSDILNREQALEFIGCSSSTLLKYQKEGLPFYQIGRKVMFRKSEILDFSRVQLKTIK